jgi:hypothetical protein
VLLGSENDITGEHGHNGWHLFLLVHEFFAGVGLELICYLFVDTGEDPHDVSFLAVFLQVVAQRLDKPGSLGGISPGEIT